MSDLADFQKTFENRFFHIACQDVVRIVSVLSLDSTDIRTPPYKQTYLQYTYDKLIFFIRFLYMIFIKGFTPTVFDVLPYTLWKVLTIVIYVYRLTVVPIWLRFTGYARYTQWIDLGKKQPPLSTIDSTDLTPISASLQVYKDIDLTKTDRLAKVQFGDSQYETFLQVLYQRTTHLSPHSQSPGNIFTMSYNGFPGNFFDHLTGVYKILLAWQQPRYLLRAGLFHSVYGTYDYRYCIFDLTQNGRKDLSQLIGEDCEEIVFVLCTSDRIGLLQDLYLAMYGKDATLDQTSNNHKYSAPDGNPYPKLIGELTEDGFPVRNHVTQKIHAIPSDLFAQFILVTIADFMEQGAIGLQAADMDICLFQFLRFRFFNDLILFIKPFLRKIPPVWEKYMGQQTFIEPLREEIIFFRTLWENMWKELLTIDNADEKKYYVFERCERKDLMMVLDMVVKYPYLSEPRILLSIMLRREQTFMVSKFH